jgi:hypothetical protein
MHPVLQYLLGCLGAALIGFLSASFVVLIWWFLNRRASARLELVFSLAGLLGMLMTAAGEATGHGYIAAAGGLLWGWTVLPVLLLPTFFVWRLIVWCCRRFAPNPTFQQTAASSVPSRGEISEGRGC